MGAQRRPSFSDCGNADTVAKAFDSLINENDEEIPMDNVSETVVEGKQVTELGRLEIFFDGYWNELVHKFRWPIILFGFGLAAYAAVRSTEIKGLSRMEDYFYPSHYMSIGLKTH